MAVMDVPQDIFTAEAIIKRQRAELTHMAANAELYVSTEKVQNMFKAAVELTAAIVAIQNYYELMEKV
jgi:hypothetical protein